MLQYLVISNHLGVSEYLCNPRISVDLKIHRRSPEVTENDSVFPEVVIRTTWGNGLTLKLSESHRNGSFAPRFSDGNFTSQRENSETPRKPWKINLGPVPDW